MTEYTAKAIQSLYEYLDAELQSELSRVELAESMPAGYLAKPVLTYGGYAVAHVATQLSVYAMAQLPMSAGQRNQKYYVDGRVELRLKGAAPNTSVLALQGSPGSNPQNDYYKLYHYAAALTGMFEPRASDANGTSHRPTLGGRINNAKMQRIVYQPLTQSDEALLHLGLTVELALSVTLPVIG